jgi:hypothetical protein
MYDCGFDHFVFILDVLVVNGCVKYNNDVDSSTRFTIDSLFCLVDTCVGGVSCPGVGEGEWTGVVTDDEPPNKILGKLPNKTSIIPSTEEFIWDVHSFVAVYSEIVVVDCWKRESE